MRFAAYFSRKELLMGHYDAILLRQRLSESLPAR